MIIETGAKVNLTLEMIRRRADGYHELASVFQAIDLCDRIELRPAAELSVEVVGAALPADATNLCWRAAALLAERLGRPAGVAIRLEKRIPVGAGLGGGSGNAAGVLGALNQLWEAGLTLAELSDLAAELGSDVPFFLRGGAALGTGRGERLEPLPPLTGYRLIVLAPAEPVATGRVYRALTDFRADAGEISRRLSEGLRAGTIGEPAEWLVNDLEAPSAAVSEGVRRDRERLAELDLPAWRLSGSGGAWFLPVRPEAAAATCQRLRGAWPGRGVWETAPVGWGWRQVETEETASWDTSKPR